MHPYAFLSSVTRPCSHFPNRRVMETVSFQSKSADPRHVRRMLRRWFGRTTRIHSLIRQH